MAPVGKEGLSRVWARNRLAGWRTRLTWQPKPPYALDLDSGLQSWYKGGHVGTGSPHGARTESYSGDLLEFTLQRAGGTIGDNPHAEA